MINLEDNSSEIMAIKLKVQDGQAIFEITDKKEKVKKVIFEITDQPDIKSAIRYLNAGNTVHIPASLDQQFL
jgi:hypothetical protein